MVGFVAWDETGLRAGFSPFQNDSDSHPHHDKGSPAPRPSVLDAPTSGPAVLTAFASHGAQRTAGVGCLGAIPSGPPSGMVSTGPARHPALQDGAASNSPTWISWCGRDHERSEPQPRRWLHPVSDWGRRADGEGVSEASGRRHFAQWAYHPSSLQVTHDPEPEPDG